MSNFPVENHSKKKAPFGAFYIIVFFIYNSLKDAIECR